ncbi:MAG: cytochrome c nitrite reductase small subunit [Desulfocapsaceae bacterium]|nr:cytochrome c nitrite reductase small subunit [Desulfocapsaceae bacterium]
MKSGRILVPLSIVTFIVALGIFGYLLNASQAFSYLSTDPVACINCHVMNSQYATWQHSSHREVASCVDCHLPTDNVVDKYMAKARDGWNHSVAFTLNTYEQNIRVSEDGAARIQENCRSCHARLVENIVTNEQRYHDFKGIAADERKCWDCHRGVPHGRVRSLSSTPDNLGVREL